ALLAAAPPFPTRRSSDLRYPGARVVFGVHHVVGADPLEDPAVLGGDRLRPDELRSDIHEVAGRQHARLEGGADPDDGDGKLPRPELLERFGVGRIRLDDGEPPRSGPFRARVRRRPAPDLWASV